MSWSASVLLGLLLSATLGLRAAETPQPKGPQPEVKIEPATPGARPTRSDPRPRRTRDPMDFWVRYLGLTDEQKVKVRPVFAEETKKLGELRRNRELSAPERKAQLQTIRGTTDRKLKEILTAEQWEKYSKRGQRPASRPAGSLPPVRPIR